MINANKFLRIIKDNKKEIIYKLGTIDPSYSSGRPKVKFDGETTVSQKQYPYLSSYTPVANDRVLMLSVSGSYVILGKIV